MIANPIGYPITNPIRSASGHASDFDPIGIPRPDPTRPEPHSDQDPAHPYVSNRLTPSLRSVVLETRTQLTTQSPTNSSLIGELRPRVRMGGLR